MKIYVTFSFYNKNFNFFYIKHFLINYTKIINEINNKLTKKKIRFPNFPSEISENIVKFCLKKKYNSNPTWDTKSGDLIDGNFKIEVKGFSSNGPISFGPSEDWDILYFANCKEYQNKYFEIYEIKLSNKDTKFRNIQLTLESTFGEIADANQRGRLRACFTKFEKELKKNCVLIFKGYIDELN